MKNVRKMWFLSNFEGFFLYKPHFFHIFLNEIPRYHIVEMGVNHLTKEREDDHRKDFKTINSSSLFHVAVFTSNCTTFKASPRLCLCDACVVEYSLYELFRSYEIQVQQLNSVNLRQNEPPPEIVGEEEVCDFVMPDSVVAVAAPKSSADSVVDQSS